jgi:hypothetical protein
MILPGHASTPRAVTIRYARFVGTAYEYYWTLMRRTERVLVTGVRHGFGDDSSVGIAHEIEDEMEQLSGKVSHFQSTRRWPRHQVDLSVRIIALNGILTTPVPARGSEISRAGMALHATLAAKPGDLMQLQFPTSTPSRVKALVRNRAGECLGLEFVTQLPPDNEARDRSGFLPSSVLGGSPELRKSVCDSCNPQTLYAGLRRKQEELRQVQREIEALHMAILLLAEDEKELSKLSVPGWLELHTRPWLGFSVSASSARKT